MNNTGGRWNCLWTLTSRLTGRQAWCDITVSWLETNEITAWSEQYVGYCQVLSGKQDQAWSGRWIPKSIRFRTWWQMIKKYEGTRLKVVTSFLISAAPAPNCSQNKVFSWQLLSLLTSPLAISPRLAAEVLNLDRDTFGKLSTQEISMLVAEDKSYNWKMFIFSSFKVQDILKVSGEKRWPLPLFIYCTALPLGHAVQE